LPLFYRKNGFRERGGAGIENFSISLQKYMNYQDYQRILSFLIDNLLSLYKSLSELLHEPFTVVNAMIPIFERRIK
jgi:hypothetical protein